MAAAGITQVLQATNLSKRRRGFLGYSPAAAGSVSASLQRPDLLASDAGFYRACVIVAGLMFAVGVLHVRSRAGRA